MAVLIDLSDRTSIESSTDGDQAVREAVVTGVSGSGNTYLENALGAAGVPAEGDAHPTRSNLKCFSRRCNDLGCGKVRIILRYRGSSSSATFQRQEPPSNNDDGEIKHVSFSTITVQKTKDILGADIVVQPPSIPGTPAHDFTGAGQQTKKANVDIVIGRIRFERNEVDFPGARMRSFINKLNLGAEGPYAAETLRCVLIDAKSPNEGDWYNVVYEFAYRSDGWKTEHTWELPGGEQPPEHTASSRIEVDHYETTSYTSLSLGFAD